MKIFLSVLAEAKIEDLLIFLETNWNTKVKNDFLEKLNLKMNQISQLPLSCQESKQFPGLYKCVVSRQTSFYYRINNMREEIEVVTFFDNRQIKR